MIGDLFLYYRGFLQLAIVLGLALWAALHGKQPEKVSAAILTGMLLADYPHHWLFPETFEYHDIIIGHFVIDLGTFIALVPLAMRANRIYPIWLLAAQIISLLMHFQRELIPGIAPTAYFVLTHGPSWVQVVALTIGMVSHRRRTARFNSYRSWRKSSSR